MNEELGITNHILFSHAPGRRQFLLQRKFGITKIKTTEIYVILSIIYTTNLYEKTIV